MNIDKSQNLQSNSIQNVVQNRETKGFLSKLKLDSKSLEKLSLISDLAISRLPTPSVERLTSYSANKSQNSEKDLETKLVALKSLGKEIRQLIDQEQSPNKPNVPIKEFTWNHYRGLMKELDDFETTMQLVFGDDSHIAYKKNIEEIKDRYRQQWTAHITGDEKKYADLEKEVELLQEKITNQIISYIPRSLASDQELIGARLIASLVEENKIRSLLNKASDTHQMMEELRGSLTQQISFHGTAVKDPEMRRQLYGHVKYIQERTRDLVEIEQTRKKSFFSLVNIPRRAKLNKDFKDLKVLADMYYKQFNFNEDEVKEFRDLSLEAHRPKRQHLVMFANDILEGARNEGEKIERKLQDDLLKEFVKATHPTCKEFLSGKGNNLIGLIDAKFELKKEWDRLDGLKMRESQTGKNIQEELQKVEGQIESLKDTLSDTERGAIENYEQLKSSPEEFKQKLSRIETHTDSEEFKTSLKVYQQKIYAVKQYRWTIDKLTQEAKEHPHIGNRNPQENLSDNIKKWKKEQKQAKEAIQEIFDDLKEAYCGLVQEVEDKEMPLKDAADVLRQARDGVIADKARWDKPIIRNIEFSTGNLPSSRGKIAIQHQMVCSNEGYPSSGFRGRTISPDTHQPNLQEVTITDGVNQLGHYTSSASNVEFSLEGDSEYSEPRNKSTEHQTMEILFGKVSHRLNALSVDQRKTVGTKDNPIVLDVPITNLLTPDSLRDWLMKNPNMQNTVEFLGVGHIDPSRLELRMLNESVDAWNSFDRRNERDEKDTFTIRGKDGKLRLIEPQFDGRNTSYAISVLDEKGDKTETVYAQFDISCYNVGCNKWSKRMNDFAFGKGIEEVAEQVIKPFRFFLGAVGKPIEPYKSGNAGNVEDVMNDKAFLKDTEKYERKCQEIRKAQVALVDDSSLSEDIFIEIGKEKIQSNINDLLAEIESLEQENNPDLAPQILERQKEFQELVKFEGEILGDTANLPELLKDQLLSWVARGEIDAIKVRAKLRGEGLRKVDELIYGSMNSDFEFQGGIRQLRMKLAKAEFNYHNATKKSEIAALDKERKLAFQAWQSKRDELAKLLDLEINVKPQTPDNLKLLNLIKHQEDLNDIYHEVSDLLKYKEFRHPKYMKQNMYILPSALVVLGQELDADPHTGCRSGKDRTSVQRMEIGVRLLQKQAYGRHLNFREQEQHPLTSKIREQMLLNSGQIDDLAFLNIGSSGLNLTESYGAYLKDFGRNSYRHPPWFANIISYGAKNVFVMNLE